MAAMSPNDVATRWAQNLGAATSRITAGVQAVQQAPGAKAAAQKQVYVQNVTAAADKWASRVSAVSLGTWQQDMINKGVSRVGPGATAAVPKMTAFMSQLLPYIDSQKASLPARGNLDQNISRMTSWVRAMSNFKYTKA